MAEQTILVVGSLNMDQVVRVPRLPVLGETLLGAGALKLVPGGKGANQAVAVARLGGHVTMAGRVGKDPFGTQLQASLQANQVGTELIMIDEDEASGVAFIFLSPEGNNAIVVASGANMRVGKDTRQNAAIERFITGNQERVQALVLQMEIPLETVLSLTALGHRAGVPVVLNLAPAQPLPKDALRKLTMLIVNETEASLLSGQQVNSLEDARIVATILHKQGIGTVVVTLGAQGAVLATGDGSGTTNTFYQPAPTVQVIDTTAAGDCFVAAMTVALTEQQPPEDALRFAISASALKVTQFGAQSGLPTRDDVEAFMRAQVSDAGT